MANIQYTALGTITYTLKQLAVPSPWGGGENQVFRTFLKVGRVEWGVVTRI